MHTVLGIDLGTQHLKVIFYDFEQKTIIASEAAALDLYQSMDGTAEQQAHWWIDALHQALSAVDQSIKDSVVAIGVSGQQHGFVPINASGEPLISAKLWCDTSTQAQCDTIMSNYGSADSCLNDLGNLILTGYTASKVRWFKEVHPELYAQMDCILLPHDYLNFYLTEQRCMEVGDASGTGFLNIRTRTWSEKLLSAIDPERNLKECLPKLVIENQFIGEVTRKVSNLTGLPVGTPVSIGGGDNMMGAIGTGNIKQGKVSMSLGTSGTVYAYSDKPIIDTQGSIAGFCSSTGGWLPLLCTMNCTVTTENMRRLLNADIAQFESQISSAARGSGGVLTLPFFNGERTPNLPNAKACIIGLDSNNCTPQNFLRSGVEGATYALRFGIDELQKLGIQTEEIVVTGGGAKSATWRQLVANICNAPVTVLDQDQGAALGAALQALAAFKNIKNKDLNSLTETHLSKNTSLCCEPQLAAVNHYQHTYQQYQQAVETIMPLYS